MIQKVNWHFVFIKTKLQQVINIKFHALFTSKKDSFQLSFTVLFTIDYKTFFRV